MSIDWTHPAILLNWLFLILLYVDYAALLTILGARKKSSASLSSETSPQPLFKISVVISRTFWCEIARSQVQVLVRVPTIKSLYSWEISTRRFIVFRGGAVLGWRTRWEINTWDDQMIALLFRLVFVRVMYDRCKNRVFGPDHLRHLIFKLSSLALENILEVFRSLINLILCKAWISGGEWRK